MVEELLTTIVKVLATIIIIVAVFFIIFRLADSVAIGTARESLKKFLGELDEARNSQREITLQLPEIVQKVEIVPADSGKGKACLSQTCTVKCLESDYYVFVTFSGAHNPECIEEELCCNVLFTEKTLLGTSTSSSIGGKIMYTMQVSYDYDQKTFNAVITESKGKDWSVQVNEWRRSIFG